MDLMASYLMLKAGTFFLSTNSTILVSLLNPSVPLIGVAVFLSAPVRCRYSASSNLLTLPADSCPLAKKETTRTTAKNFQSSLMNYLLHMRGNHSGAARCCATVVLPAALHCLRSLPSFIFIFRASAASRLRGLLHCY